MPDQPAPTRRTRRPLVVAVSGLATLVMLVVVASVWVGHRLDVRVTEGIDCRLPDGVHVTDVDVHGNALVALATRDVDGIDVSVEASAASLEAIVARVAPPALPEPTLTISNGVLGLGIDGAGVPATLVLEPSFSDGTLRLTPDSVEIGDRSFSPEFFAGALGDLPLPERAEGGDRPDPLGPRDLPLRALPEGAEVTDVHVGADSLEVDVAVSADAASRFLEDPPTDPCAAASSPGPRA
jgi:hypothetical protein